MIKFIDSFVEPDPRECTYWIDLTSDQYMSVIKYYNGTEWVRLNDIDLSKINQVNIENSLTSDDKTKALSALQGKILNDTLNALLNRIHNLEQIVNKKAIGDKSSK